MLFRPSSQVLLGRQVLMDAPQIVGDQVARDVEAATGAFRAVALGAADAELAARRIDDGQRLFGHGCVLVGEERD
jgi:hypothetical protein